MPNLLPRNPFHNHHKSSPNSSASTNASPNSHPNANANSNMNPNNGDHSQGRMKNNKSFLHFIHRGQSNDSLRSDISIDSSAGNVMHSQRNNSQTNLNNLSSPVHKPNTNSTGNHHQQQQHHTSPHHHNASLYDSASPTSPKASHSMAELKRFFRPSLPKRKSSNLSAKDNNNPSTSTISMSPYGRKHDHHLREKSSAHDNSHTQSAIPPSSDSTLSLSNKLNIYHDDSILAQKYGKLGKLLGSGAGGSVKILTRPSDGATFAVKEFRPRKANESVKEYSKKCTAEFLIGSTLTHPNVIETLDIFSDAKQNKYFEVMEYCPIDFFAVVMTGKMSRGEINCCIKQISKGVQYLHSKGLAHRDLKLDNCVMTSNGIIKLIDFGSAVVFKYPFENKITLAHGIVGSDPYLAPEVITSTKSYDPQFVDVWSIGIIFCCLMLKRFPWKAPRQDTDENFKYFCMEDDMEHDYVASAKHNELVIRERIKKKHEKEEILKKQKEKSDAIREGRLEEYLKEHAEEVPEADVKTEDEPVQEKTDAITASEEKGSAPVEANNDDKAEETKINKETPETNKTDEPKQVAAHVNHSTRHHKGVIHGPYRLLRLLPHASRPILSKMLLIDPAERATMDDMFKDEWFQGIACCTIDSKKNLVPAPGHHHTLVDEKDAHLESYKQ
ncbi:hypothetical protein TPHA_0G01450 [Tetrapisispora phaffii CBS 4417]|uniref:non-specific serine/threonine protein kinase n=1 Tax=Tetrapisispora phaffii (strain ATCC 24235 / CBS 4417 / NBRC 1672 / NRRL Y-8282 / UCD 70-5) TaxID=1071381 RepID=G8BVQ4_TETPH|nr:hypothetical protein TPHA_0G01450 [Tetrapisispora phaffii CBS 4417]CCE63982.1 hypothetical protein TPHA_0G01450 [Tetrapisispora phaffii CBS 4417]